jgi:hypothetical protein
MYAGELRTSLSRPSSIIQVAKLACDHLLVSNSKFSMYQVTFSAHTLPFGVHGQISAFNGWSPCVFPILSDAKFFQRSRKTDPKPIATLDSVIRQRTPGAVTGWDNAVSEECRISGVHVIGK